ncbi:hypothetical protein ES703_87166 [subsurface metagenome]
MKLLRRLRTEETGHILILSLIVLTFGSLVMVPFLDFVRTGFVAGSVYEKKMIEIYAADAGIEDAVHRINKLITPLDTMKTNDETSYAVDPVNGKAIDITIKKLSLLEGLLGDNEFKVGQTHESWVQFNLPADAIVRDPDEDWVEYKCLLSFHYDGSGSRQVKTAGVYFSPYPGAIIEGPYDEQATLVMTFDNLESRQTKIAAGGFAFIYRWLNNSGPIFDKNNRNGSISLRFKVHDADWTHGLTFFWATFKEQDVSFVTTTQLTKWLVIARAGSTEIRAQILRDNGQIKFSSWEINPPD